jgi:hypothetical protein
VGALSADDIWAVGDTETRPTRTLAAHWNGTSWKRVSTPTRAHYATLNGVAVVTTEDAWAVGAYEHRDGLGGGLIEHWNGSRWSMVPFEPPHAIGVTLSAVAEISSKDVWAVGLAFLADGTFAPVTEHYDGTSWSLVPSWRPPEPGGYLTGVAAISADDVWAVGSIDDGLSATLVEHWDGSTWTHIASPNPGGRDEFNDLYGVTAVSSSDVWAVGGYTTPKSHGKTLALHWDGRRWTQVPTPTPHGSSDSLDAVDGSHADLWAVGSTGEAALIEHWNGSTWRPVSTPAPGHKSFGAVTSVSKRDAWAVGGDYWARQPVLEHWDGDVWVRR